MNKPQKAPKTTSKRKGTEPSSIGESSLRLPLDVGLFTLLGAALLYYTGWTFAYHYWGRFRLGLLAMDLPREFYLIYGFSVVDQYHMIFILLLILMFVISIGMRALRRLFGRHNVLLNIVVAVFLPMIIYGMFVLCFILGSKTAEEQFLYQRNHDYPNHPRVRIILAAQDDPEFASMKDSLKGGCYRKLLQNKDHIFLFYSLKSVPTAELPLVTIPLSQVLSIKTLPLYMSCGD